jgi:hypothetical protein
MATIVVEVGRGLFNGNNFRFFIPVAYADSLRSVVIYADGKIINGQSHDFYHDQLYHDSGVILSGAGLSGRRTFGRFDFDVSVEYQTIVSKEPTAVTPKKAMFFEGNTSVKILGPFRVTAGGLYTDKPLGLRGPSRIQAGILYKF